MTLQTKELNQHYFRNSANILSSSNLKPQTDCNFNNFRIHEKKEKIKILQQRVF